MGHDGGGRRDRSHINRRKQRMIGGKMKEDGEWKRDGEVLLVWRSRPVFMEEEI